MKITFTYISVIDIISFIFILFNIFILLTLVRMHSKQKSIRVGYFIVVFIQIIIELLLSILFLIVIILSFLKENEVINNEKYLYIFPVLINFLYNIDILYNIQTIVCLMKAKNKIESSDAFTSDDLSKSEEGGNSNISIDIKTYSFRRIHFISFFFSFIHSFIYALIIFKEDQNPNMDWYFYFYDQEKDNLFYLFFFVFNIAFFILSIIYCFTRQKINETIKLKHYSIYCFIFSLISLIFPLKIILNNIIYEKGNENEDDEYEEGSKKVNEEITDIMACVYSFLLLFFFMENSYFRLNCYYVQNILSKKGNNCWSKFCLSIQILFTKIKISPPNFIDFNNTFLFHSLSSEKDFYKEKEKRLVSRTESIELNTSRSFSLTEA